MCCVIRFIDGLSDLPLRDDAPWTHSEWSGDASLV
jgi:hypothetical protein